MYMYVYIYICTCMYIYIYVCTLYSCFSIVTIDDNHTKIVMKAATSCCDETGCDTADFF